jgi:hypothetical protein
MYTRRSVPPGAIKKSRNLFGGKFYVILRDYVTIIETGIPEIYFRLDTLARDRFIEIMQAEYSEYTKED